MLERHGGIYEISYIAVTGSLGQCFCNDEGLVEFEAKAEVNNRMQKSYKDLEFRDKLSMAVMLTTIHSDQHVFRTLIPYFTLINHEFVVS